MKRISGLKLAIVIAVILGFVSNTGLARSIWFAKFGKPIVCKDHIVFTSVNKKKLICIDLRGKKIWEKKYSKPIIENRRDDNSIVIQVGRRVIAVDIPAGKETPMFEIRSKHETIHFDQQSGLAWSRDDRKKHRMFRMLDPGSGTVLWERPDVAGVSLVLEKVLICVTGKRVYSKEGYHITDAVARALDRTSGKQIWELALGRDHKWGWLPAVYLPPYIVFLVGDGRLVCVQTSDGQVVKTMGEDYDPERVYVEPGVGRIWHMAARDGLLVYMTEQISGPRAPSSPEEVGDYLEEKIKWTEEQIQKLQRGEENLRHYYLHFVGLPALEEQSVIELSHTAVASFEFYDRYIITDTIHNTACFEGESGRRMWKKGQLDRTQPIDGKIYFSEHVDKNKIRIGVIDIPSGEETTLYEEKIPWWIRPRI